MKKTCKTCLVEKDLECFHKHRSCLYGVRNTCKGCRKVERKEYHEANREKENTRNKMYSMKNLEEVRARSNAYRKENYNTKKAVAISRKSQIKHLLRHKARNIIADRVRRGILEKGDCAYPNGKCRGRIEAHHIDYNQPLNITWFCNKHHKLADKVQKLLTNQYNYGQRHSAPRP